MSTITRRRLMMHRKDEVIDLSLQDIYGNPIARSTANCYVISKPGKYKFPLVYGNAIKNGQVNTTAFTYNGSSNCIKFINSSDDVITSPYIEEMEGKALSMDIACADEDDMLLDKEFVEGDECSFVQFSVPKIPDVGANVVIRVSTKNSGYWAWLIWLWPDDLSPIEIIDTNSRTYRMLPVNLASKWDDSTKSKIKNWFYQFGRPTPLLCPESYNSNTIHPSASGYLTDSVDTVANIQDGLGVPTRHIIGSATDHSWHRNNIYGVYNIWNTNNSVSGIYELDPIKSVYDPCPVGWRVPTGIEFASFSKSKVVGEFENGWRLKTYDGDEVGAFFPASGYIRYFDGERIAVGSKGSVLYSSTYNEKSASRMSFEEGKLYEKTVADRSEGHSIRPVEDDMTIIVDSFYGFFSIITVGTFKFDLGMTWEDFVKSSYNNGKFYIWEDFSIMSRKIMYDGCEIGYNLQFEEANQQIISSRIYQLLYPDVQ